VNLEKDMVMKEQIRLRSMIEDESSEISSEKGKIDTTPVT